MVKTVSTLFLVLAVSLIGIAPSVGQDIKLDGFTVTADRGFRF